jgi:hypothetical protein
MSRLRLPPPADADQLLDPRAFIAARVRRDLRYETTNAEMYSVYKQAAADAGLEPASHRALSRALLANGFRQAPSRKGGRVWSFLLILGTEPQE